MQKIPNWMFESVDKQNLSYKWSPRPWQTPDRIFSPNSGMKRQCSISGFLKAPGEWWCLGNGNHELSTSTTIQWNSDEKNRFPIENIGNMGKSRFGVWGGLGAIFIVYFKKRVARKPHRVVLLHFGLVTFRTENLWFSWFRIWGRVYDSQNQLCLT